MLLLFVLVSFFNLPVSIWIFSRIFLHCSIFYIAMAWCLSSSESGIFDDVTITSAILRATLLLKVIFKVFFSKMEYQDDFYRKTIKNICKRVKVMYRKMWSFFPATIFICNSWHWCRGALKQEKTIQKLTMLYHPMLFNWLLRNSFTAVSGLPIKRVNTVTTVVTYRFRTKDWRMSAWH